jgi:RNA polymerase sigma-70 factor, ECF subfamily
MEEVASLPLGTAAADPAPSPDLADVYKQHARSVRRMLFRSGIRDADVDDVLQDVFVVVQKRLHTYDGSAPLLSWIHGITTRVAAAHRRRAHVRREAITDTIGSIDAPDRSPEETAALAQARSQLEKALGRLSEDARAIFVLSEIDEMSGEDIARHLDIPIGTVYSRLHRARRAFAAELSGLDRDRRATDRGVVRHLVGAVAAFLFGLKRRAAAQGLRRAIGWSAAVLTAGGLVAVLAVGRGQQDARTLSRGAGEPATTSNASAVAPAASTGREVASIAALPKAPIAPGHPALPGREVEAPAQQPVEVLFEEDFETGPPLPVLADGEVVPGPPRPGSRFCAIGTLSLRSKQKGKIWAVSVATGPLLFSYSRDIVVAFDYWVDASNPSVWLQLHSPSKRQNYVLQIKAPAVERWEHAEIPLLGLIPIGRSKIPLEEGDRVDNLRIKGGRLGGAPLYVDNIRIFRRSSGPVVEAPRTP